MSLIVYTVKNGFPILIGDLLISAVDNRYSAEIPVYMQSFPNIQSKQKLFPESLKQKLYIINQDLAVCLAGFVDEMKNLLQDIKAFFKYYPITFENLEKFWDQYNRNDFEKSACIFLVAEKVLDKTFIKVKKIGNWNYELLNVFGHVFSYGSGSRSIFEHLKEIELPLKNYFGGNLHKVTIARHLIAICRLIGSEYFSGDSIINSWGGGYELITYDGTKFLKIDDSGFLIWNCKFDDKGSYDLQLRLAVNYKYYNSLLLITVNNSHLAKRYGILEMGADVTEINLDSIPNEYIFSSKRIACCNRIQFPDGTFRISMCYLETESETLDNFVSISILKSGHTQLKIEKELESKLHQDILSFKEIYFRRK